MLDGIPARAGVVPLEPILNVRGAANVVPRGITYTAKDIHESGADTAHAGWVTHISRRRKTLATVSGRGARDSQVRSLCVLG